MGVTGGLPMPDEAAILAICEKANAREFIESFPNCPGPGRFSGLRVLHSTSILCGAFVWALNSPKRLFPAPGSAQHPRRRARCQAFRWAEAAHRHRARDDPQADHPAPRRGDERAGPGGP
jgi:hypothetical protein